MKILIGINSCLHDFLKEVKTSISPITKTGNPIIAKNAAKVRPIAPITRKANPL